MNYLQKNKRDREYHQHLPTYIALGCAVLVIAVQSLFPAFWPTFFTTLARPFWNRRVVTYTQQTTNPVIDPAAISSQTLAIALAENAQLKEILGRASGKDIVLGTVLSRPPFSPYDTLVVDVGSRNSVALGDSVMVAGNILIGEVVEVHDATSKIKLYSSPGETYDIRIGTKKIEATAHGRGGGSFDVIVPRETGVIVGDAVYAPSIEPTIFGTVTAISNDPARAYVTALFQSPINIALLTWVQIIR